MLESGHDFIIINVDGLPFLDRGAFLPVMTAAARKPTRESWD
jgi:hypothetical protein